VRVRARGVVILLLGVALFCLCFLPLLPYWLLRWRVYVLVRKELGRYLPQLSVSPTWATDPVPLTVHFVVPSNKTRWPPVWQQCHESWRACLPGHSLRFWNDEEMEALVRSSYPQFAKVYAEYGSQIQRADMARYLILHHEGGIYADSDYQCVNNFAPLLKEGRVSIAESPHSGEIVQNSLMASPPGHPFWAYVLRELLSNVFVEDIVLSTGPRAVLIAVDKAPQRWVALLPRKKFAQWPGKREQRSTLLTEELYTGSDVYAVHIGTESWKKRRDVE
jgi:mannosyltransferase OCH1-like enzyme